MSLRASLAFAFILTGCPTPQAPGVTQAIPPPEGATDSSSSSPSSAHTSTRFVPSPGSTSGATVEHEADGQRVTVGRATFTVPADWLPVQASAALAADVAYHAPERVGDFVTNVNLVSEKYDAGDSDAYAAANVDTLRQITGVTVRTKTRVKIGELDGVDVESLWDNERAHDITLQRFVVFHGRGHVMTCAMTATKPERVRGVCEAILGSLRFRMD